MFHFIIGLMLGVTSAVVADHFWHDTLITAFAGVGVALLYWLIVGICKGVVTLSGIDIDFPGLGD